MKKTRNKEQKMETTKKMTPYLSDKLKALSFMSIIMVVFIHTFYTEGSNYQVLSFIESLIGGSMARIAVPLFYFISGYLLFLHMDSLASCLGKIKKRMRTLLVPYLIANTLSFCFYLSFDLLARIVPGMEGVMNFHVMEWFDDGWGEIISKTYWEPIAFQLWFVRDMLIFIWLLPIIQFLLRWISKTKASALLDILVLLFLQVYSELLVLSMAIGGLISLGRVYDLTKVCTNCWITLGSSLIFLALIVAHALGNDEKVCEAMIPMVGIVAVWYVYDMLLKGKMICQTPKGKVITSYTFFIYLTHIPLLLIFKKLPLMLSQSEWMLTCCYLLVPFIYCAFAILLGAFLKKKIPSFYYLYAGGR